MLSTEFVGVIGTGRNGTLAISKILELDLKSEVHHEYNFEPTLKLGFLRKHGLITHDSAVKYFRNSHYSATYYSDANRFIDCSNALSQLVPTIASMPFKYKIIDIPRNGRRVVSSFYYKFQNLMYPKRAVETMNKWLSNQNMSTQEPPPDKRFWRTLPSSLLVENNLNYRLNFDEYRFAAICNYWVDTNHTIISDLQKISASLVYKVKFEDLFNPQGLKKLTDFLGVRIREEMLEKLSRPINVHQPINYKLTAKQEEIFIQICGETMKDLGYDLESDYDTNY